MANAVGYIRVSTDKQELGPEAQQEAIESWCERNGAALVGLYIDRLSGGLEPDQRPGFMEALGALVDRRAELFVVARRDRLARDTMVVGMIERLVEREGGRIVSAAGEGTDIDPNDPSGMIIRGVIDLFAAYERALIRTRIRAALAVKRRRGEVIGTVPFGWRAETRPAPTADNPERVVRVLVPDEGEQSAIALVRQLHADGVSLRQIAATLDEARISCRGARWHKTTVARILERAEKGQHEPASNSELSSGSAGW